MHWILVTRRNGLTVLSPVYPEEGSHRELLVDPAMHSGLGYSQSLSYDHNRLGGDNGLVICLRQPTVECLSPFFIPSNELQQPRVIEFPFVNAGRDVRRHKEHSPLWVADVRGFYWLDKSLAVGRRGPRAGAHEALAGGSSSVIGARLGGHHSADDGESIFADELMDVDHEAGYVLVVVDLAGTESMEAVDEHHREFGNSSPGDGNCSVDGLVLVALLVQESEVRSGLGRDANSSHVGAEGVCVALAGHPAVRRWIGGVAEDWPSVAPIVHDLKHQGGLAGSGRAEDDVNLVGGKDLIDDKS